MLSKKNVKFLANWKEVCYYVYIKQKKWGEFCIKFKKMKHLNYAFNPFEFINYKK